jgi:uncharacterized protein (TIGR00106 family)
MLVELKIMPTDGVRISRDVAKAVGILKRHGLSFQVGPMGTSMEGDWEQVFAAIRECHEAVLKDHERVITTITIDDRKHFHHRLSEMVGAVEFWDAKAE